MKIQDIKNNQIAELRQRAEKISGSRMVEPPENLGNISPEETWRIIHELQVHQIELEIQNEELRRAQDEISVTQARYFDLYDMAPVGYCTLSENGLIMESNLTAAALLGAAREALIKRPLSQFIFNEDQDIYYLHHRQLVDTGMPQAFELRLVKIDETVFWARLNTTALHDAANTPAFRVVLSDITEHRMAVEALRQSELRESEDRFRKLFEQHSAVKLILDAETGDIIDANEAAVKFYGWPLEKLKQMNIREINTLPPEDVQARLKKAALSGNVRFEFRHRRADGSIRDVEVFSNRIESAERDYLYSIIHDITERKWAEEEREAMIEFLRFINDSQGTEGLIHAATAYFRKHSGCEAVGIRLQEGDDYPYYETRGFPEEFVQAENRLCTCDETGRPLRDSDGKPVLKCMCGNVISSRVDPSKPFFTTKGSFWTNCATELLSSTSEADRQAGTLDRCIGQGYESIALIPLQVGAGRLGLLQLNDRSKGRFTIETITLWERLAGYLAVALAKFGADEALRRAKEEWERTFDSVPDLIAILDNRHRVVRVNQAMARRLGVQPADCVGLHCYETVHGTSCPPALCPHSQTIMDGCEHSQELHEDRLGGDFLVTTTPLLNEKGERVGSVHVAHDITERKQAETALRQSEERYHSLFNLMLEGFCIIEVQFDADNRPVDYRFLEVNPAFEKQTGLHNVQGKLIRELIPEIEAYWFEIFGKVALTGESRRFVNEARALNRWYDVSAYRIEGPDSRKVAIVFNDITESRHAHAALKKLNDHLEKRVEQRTRELQETQAHFLHAEKLSAIGKLSASIAHEFNNPLQGIMSILKGLQKRAILEEEDRELLEAAIIESDRMKNLIRSLQDFNRPSSGKKVVMDVQKSIDSLLMLCKNDFKTKRISTVLNYAERLPVIVAIPDQIKQVLLNLLTNAADACSQRGGVITISTRQEEERVAVAIKDTGTGIAPENIDLIFQPFYTTKAEVKGTGLGLSICHGIIQSHQGEIRVESWPGEGSTFTVLLPVKGA